VVEAESRGEERERRELDGWRSRFYSMGGIKQRARVRALDGFERVHLVTVGDGRVLLTAAARGHFVLALLSAEPFTRASRVRLDGVRVRKGVLAASPQVQGGRISAALAVRRGRDEVVDVRHVATVAELDRRWPELEDEMD